MLIDVGRDIVVFVICIYDLIQTTTDIIPRSYLIHTIQYTVQDYNFKFQMTDNYHIDLNAIKNNKLFKKFMQNKSSVPEHEVNYQKIPQKQFQTLQNKNCHFQTNTNVQQHNLKDQPVKYERGIISNQSWNQPTQTMQIYKNPQKHNEAGQFKNKRQRTRQFTHSKNLVNNTGNQNVGKNEKSFQIRQQRARQTQSATTNINSDFYYAKPNIEATEKGVTKENQLIGNTKENQLIYQNDYKHKYQKLQQKYEQLKMMTQHQNKQIKKKLNSWEQQIQVYKEKLFIVQSRQDSLLIQNQRLKQKFNIQNLTKTKIQQENKQLTLKIQQLQELIAIRQSNLKKKCDELIYWKSQLQIYKEDFNALKLNFQTKNDQLTMTESQCQLLIKQKNNKDYLLEDLRNKIAKLVQENSLAKDQLFCLVSKLYNLQQQNQAIKADLKRGKYSLNQSFFNQQIDSISQRKQERTIQTPNRTQQKGKNESFINVYDAKRVGDGQQRKRRGQFARQRAITNKTQKQYEKQQVNNLNMTHNANQRSLQNIQLRRDFRQPEQKQKPNVKINNVQIRIQQINGQLQKIRDMKAMNGQIRGRKIKLQRELEQLEEKMRQVN